MTRSFACAAMRCASCCYTQQTRVASVADRPLLTYTYCRRLLLLNAYNDIRDTILQVDTDAYGLRWTGESGKTFKSDNNSVRSRRSRLGLCNTTVFPDNLHSGCRFCDGCHYHSSRMAHVSSQPPRLGDKTTDRGAYQTQEEEIDLLLSLRYLGLCFSSDKISIVQIADSRFIGPARLSFIPVFSI